MRRGAPHRRRREHPLGNESSGGSPRFAARIDQLATANPTASYSQDEMLDLLGLRGNEFAEHIFDVCGVQKRQFAITPELLASKLQSRVEYSEQQLVRMALEAIGQLDCDPSDIATVDHRELLLARRPDAGPQAGRAATAWTRRPTSTTCRRRLRERRAAVQARVAGDARAAGVKHALVVAAECITGFLTTVAPDDEKMKTSARRCSATAARPRC